MRTCCFVVFGFLSAALLRADLYSIGIGASGAPNNFTSITGTGVATPLFDLGDGSLAFNGGLAYHAGSDLFYGIANDWLGNSSLVSFSASGGGASTTIGALGQGFVSGLAYSSTEDRLYAISTSSSGSSVLNWIDFAGAVHEAGDLGTGFNGGLTFRVSDGLLYAFSGGASGGVQREFKSIDPSSASVTDLFELGDGSFSFSGGVAYNPHDGLFYAVSNDWSGASTLQSFTLDGPGSLNTISGIGGGYWNVGLAERPVAMPEPHSWETLALTLFMLGILLRLRPRQD